MAKTVATLQAVLSLNDSNFKQGMNNAKTSMSDAASRAQSTGSTMKSVGGQMALIAAPVAAAFGVAVNESMKFDEAVTNTGAVMLWSRGQIDEMKATLLTMGGKTREGPQAVAEAMYDIAGGVADASTHMAILQAAIHTSQAGNAGLAGTTKALISTMNSYGYSADKASKVSDVLTRTVGMGVGSMDEFASALPQVTGLAASLGIPLEDVGSMMAYLTTKGNTASEASTQLSSSMVAFLKPNSDMETALGQLGFTSGEAAIKQLGLMGAMKAVSQTSTAGEVGMAALLGRVEALRGSVALTSDDFLGFNRTFKTSIDGITAKTEAIQMGSAAAQFDLLKASISETAIKAGDALTPALTKMWEAATPLIAGVTEWIGKNPELTSQLGLLAIGGVVAGGGLSALGTVVSTGGTLLKGAGALIGFLTGPLGLVLLLGGLLTAIAVGYPGGLPGALKDAGESLKMIVGIISISFLNWVRDLAKEFHNLAIYLGLATDASGRWKAGGVTSSGGGGLAFGGGGSGGGSSGFGGGYAAGGSVMGNTSYLVGEQGPELFTPSTSGNISTAGDTARMMSGDTYNLTIYANDYAGGQAAHRGFMDAARAKGY